MKEELSKKVYNQLFKYRKKITKIDLELIRLLSKRMSVSKKIGKLKYQNNIIIKQDDFWHQSCVHRKQIAEYYGITNIFTEELFSKIQLESIKQQEQIFEKYKNAKEKKP